MGALRENTGQFCKVIKSLSLTFFFFLVYFISLISWCACVCVWVHLPKCMCEVGTCLRISYPLQACGSLGLNSGHQAGWQSLLSVTVLPQDKSSDALVNTLGQVAPGSLCKAAHLSASLSTTVTWGVAYLYHSVFPVAIIKYPSWVICEPHRLIWSHTSKGWKFKTSHHI